MSSAHLLAAVPSCASAVRRMVGRRSVFPRHSGDGWHKDTEDSCQRYTWTAIVKYTSDLREVASVKKMALLVAALVVASGLLGMAEETYVVGSGHAPPGRTQLRGHFALTV